MWGCRVMMLGAVAHLWAGFGVLGPSWPVGAH